MMLFFEVREEGMCQSINQSGVIDTRYYARDFFAYAIFPVKGFG